MSPAFWKGKRVLLTGHTGFKGSWLALWLSQMGCDVVGLSNSIPTNPSMFVVSNVSSFLEKDIRADIRDTEELVSILKKIQPEIVIHMAAQSLVRESYDNPIETYSTNVMGTVNLLYAVQKLSSVKVILNVTTDKCYKNIERDKGYVETDELGGYDPYSNSKACSELVSDSFRNSFLEPKGIASATARSGNVIGGGDWAKDRIVPDIIRACINNEKLEIRNPNSTRPWQHVLEPLSGYLQLCEQLYNQPQKYSSSWNFGPQPSDVAPVSKLVTIILDYWGTEQDWKLDGSKQPHEAKKLQLDCTKSNTVLNWSPKWDLKQALVKTVDWYRAWDLDKDMTKISLKQIEAYIEE